MIDVHTEWTAITHQHTKITLNLTYIYTYWTTVNLFATCFISKIYEDTHSISSLFTQDLKLLDRFSKSCFYSMKTTCVYLLLAFDTINHTTLIHYYHIHFGVISDDDDDWPLSHLTNQEQSICTRIYLSSQTAKLDCALEVILWSNSLHHVH